MSRIRVSATKIWVKEPQTKGEGELEVVLKVSEGNNSMEWSSARKLDNNGASQVIENGEIGYYTVTSGKLSKRFTINVTELDSGFNADDFGNGECTLSLEPNMKAITKDVNIPLTRMNSKEKGMVTVRLEAQVVR